MDKTYNIPTFSSLIYDNYIVDVNSIVNNKQYNIYKSLFNEMLSNYAQRELDLTIEEFKRDYIIIDTPSMDFYLPPSSVIFYKKDNIKEGINHIENINDYWPIYQYQSGGEDKIKIIKDKYGINEVINIDYVRNEATLHNRVENYTFKVPLSKVNKDTIFSDNLKILNSFTDLYYE